MYERKQLKELRKRLKAGNLTKDDVKELDGLVAKADKAAKQRRTIGGRPVIAHLPGGLDVVK